MDILSGVIALNKPIGWTSHDCVARVRKLLKTKKVGHTGTLDPGATGVLPLCVGRGTKIAQYITDTDKEYEGDVTLGVETTTGDQAGDIVTIKEIVNPITCETIKKSLSSLIGERLQTPPIYSAIKVRGKKLYEYARSGTNVTLPARKINISNISLLTREVHLNHTNNKFTIIVSCGKGTYIRSLAVEIGKSLGYPAHLSRLVRTRVGAYLLKNTVTIPELEQLAQAGRINDCLQSLESALVHMPKLIVSDEVAIKVKNGAVFTVDVDLPSLPSATVLYTKSGQALGFYKNHLEKIGKIKPLKIL